MSATIKDVAHEAGVSIATVSRVFNDSGPVSDRARQRVSDAAHALGYVPNGTARSLITSKTDTLGVLLPDLHGEFFAEVTRGIDQAARARGYHLLMSGSHDDEDETRAVLRALRGRVDGLLVLSARIGAQHFRDYLPEALPTVMINGKPEVDMPYENINIDNYEGAYAMTAHLAAEHGHRRITMIKGPAGSHDAAERLRGYRGALRDAGVEQNEVLELEGDFMQSTGYEQATALLRRTEGAERPTALFAANDSMAVGALSALHEAGVRVPEEMAVAGFDDVPSARYMSPPLSTVHVPVCAMGARAAERLIGLIRGDRDAGAAPEPFPTTLRLRASCGCDG